MIKMKKPKKTKKAVAKKGTKPKMMGY